MPRDRIVILEDTKGNGVCDKRTVFAEGKDFPAPFDLASGIEVGNGGVYVGAPPYLFFIENKNDKPGKFEILLKGFGSQDTHEMLNTFQWGPDGWLYGLHGVFTNSEVSPHVAPKELPLKKEPDALAKVKGPKTEPDAQARVKINAGVWRFHPKTKKFEVFAEGTSNPWGMDWRNTDGQFILCCCVIPHLYHIVPGGIYKRQAGQSFNPYAYGEIKEICDHTFHKESGWAHAGLISLDTPLMPKKYRNSVIFGSIHGCSIKQNILKPNGSSYIASRGDDFLVSGDKNFRPVNLRWGHNGEIYCIDWHDQHPCHQTNPDDWDYEHGRVYRIQPKGLKTKKAEDLGKKNGEQLAQNLSDQNPYRTRTALRLLQERAETEDVGGNNSVHRILAQGSPAIMNSVYSHSETFMKQIAGAFNSETPMGESNEDFSDAELARMVRIIVNMPLLAPKIIDNFKGAAEKSTSVLVRRELASASIYIAKSYDATPIVRALLQRKEDFKDPLIPHLLWLAYEKQLIKSRDKELVWLRDNGANNPLITDTIIPRAMRRLVATGKAEDLAACVGFIGDVKDAHAKLRALEGLVQALQNRQVDAPANWEEVHGSLLTFSTEEFNDLANKLSISFRDVKAIKRALGIAMDAGKSVQERAEAIRALALARPEPALQPLLQLAKSDAAPELRTEAIRALASFEQPEIAKALLAGYAKYSPGLKGEVIGVLAGRKTWASVLLNAVGAKAVARTDLNNNVIMRIMALKDKGLDAQIEKVWGRIRSTPAELNALIDKTRGQLYEAPASFARGKLAFDNHCAKCHKFEGRGHEVGPDIEGAGRDIEYLIVNVLDPNRVIGAPYFMRTIVKLNGQSEQGVLAAEDDQSITLKTENAVLKVIAKKDIERMRVQEKSLMPEGFGSNIKIQEFRDLIRYTMANPFITAVEVLSMKEGEKPALASRPIVGVPGRIPLPDGELGIVIRATVTAPEARKTRLLIGSRENVRVLVNDKAAAAAKGAGVAAQPDQTAVDVELKKGENSLTLELLTKGKNNAVYARFHDPDRKLRYPEPPEEKK
jgi:putative membrane-bound dehydrogenase-like protein